MMTNLSITALLGILAAEILFLYLFIALVSMISMGARKELDDKHFWRKVFLWPMYLIKFLYCEIIIKTLDNINK